MLTVSWGKALRGLKEPTLIPLPQEGGDYPILFLEFSQALPDLPTTTKVLGL